MPVGIDVCEVTRCTCSLHWLLTCVFYCNMVLLLYQSDLTLHCNLICSAVTGLPMDTVQLVPESGSDVESELLIASETSSRSNSPALLKVFCIHMQLFQLSYNIWSIAHTATTWELFSRFPGVWKIHQISKSCYKSFVSTNVQSAVIN